MRAFGKTIGGPIVNYQPGQLINGNGEVLNFTTGDMLVCVTNESMMYGKASLSTASKDELIIGNTTIAYYNILAIGIAEKIVVS